VVGELEKLKAKGHDPAELLTRAVTNGWRTVYEPKGQAQGASQAGKHAGFDTKNYREGVAEDGSLL
jgi:hypothetical protein